MVTTRRSILGVSTVENIKTESRKRKNSQIVEPICSYPSTKSYTKELAESNHYFKRTSKKVKPDNPNQDFSFLQEKPRIIHKEQSLCDNYINFETLYTEILCNFNIILYGPGSKLDYISRFITFITDLGYTVLEINGFVENFNKNDFKATIDEFASIKDTKLLVINCADKFLSRSDFCSDAIISHISGYKEDFRIMVTVDSVNASALFAAHDRYSLKWVYHSLPTFQSYIIETLNQPPIIGQKITQRCVEALKNVIKSLAPKSQQIFELMAITHLQMIEEKKKPNIEFSSFYELCRSKFLVSKEQNFKQILSELLDHKVIKSCEANMKFSVFQIMYSPDMLKSFLNRNQQETE